MADKAIRKGYTKRYLPQSAWAKLSKEEIIKAKIIVDQFNASDTGLVVIDGKLIEKPVLREMKRRILVAEKINQ